MPHSIEAEEYLLSCCLLDGADVVSRCLEARIRPQSFYLAAHGIIFERLLDLYNRQKPMDVSVVAEELKAAGQLEEIGGYSFLTQVSSRIPTTAQAGYFIDRVRRLDLLRETIKEGMVAVEACYEFSGTTDELVALKSSIAARIAIDGVSCGSVITELESRRAGFGREIPKQEPTFTLVTTPIFTRGNVSTLTAQKKEGKSTAARGMLTAVIGGPECSGDALHFKADNSLAHAVIHLDTEQSAEDHERLIATAVSCAGRSETPQWLHSYGVKGMSVAELHQTLDRLLREANKVHGGIYAVLLDGVADFVSDPNKPEECNPLVTKLESIATRYNCSVICVLHLNPAPAGQPSKSRGHLGSQLERKCETDLRIVKDKDGVTTMYTACARRAPILEKDGPRFSWDSAAGMHTSLRQTGSAIRDSAAAEGARDMAADVFGSRSSMRYTDLIGAIKTTWGCSESSAERKFESMKRHKAIVRSVPNLWSKAA